jgi:2-(1,2-epoxy-1,2-dihydrophenyl)acetyl-CoA isomerase
MALIELAKTGRVATIRINRPQVRNAMTREMWFDLVTKLQNVSEDSEIGCLVLTGSDTAFCAGGDVKAMVERAEGQSDTSAKQEEITIRAMMEAARLLHEMPKPTIAAINGACAGAGLSLALACDLRIAEVNAKFTTAFARVAGSGDFGGSWFLSRIVGTAKARELYYFATPFSGKQAEELGIVNQAVDAVEFDGTLDSWAQKLAHGPSVALGFMKKNMNLAEGGSLAEALDQEARHMALSFATEDHREAARAFVEKRSPQFKGK